MIITAKEINDTKINSDISFLKSFINFAKENNWRVVVSGGYGLDGYLGVITRSHGDLDLIIYGQSNRKDALSKLTRYLEEQIRKVKILTKPELFYLDIKIHSPNFIGNFYYVETVMDPCTDLSQVRKQDGKIVTNQVKDFPPPVTGKLNELVVEVQDQGAHLADILRRRGTDTAQSKHDQDIDNINAVLTSKRLYSDFKT